MIIKIYGIVLHDINHIEDVTITTENEGIRMEIIKIHIQNLNLIMSQFTIRICFNLINYNSDYGLVIPPPPEEIQQYLLYQMYLINLNY